MSKGIAPAVYLVAGAFILIAGIAGMALIDSNVFSILDNDNCEMVPFPEDSDVTYESLSEVEQEFNSHNLDISWEDFKQDLNLQVVDGVVMGERCIN